MVNFPLQNYILTWYQHADIVEKATAQRHLDQDEEIAPEKRTIPLNHRLPPSWQYTWLPLFFASFYGLRAMMFLVTVTGGHHSNGTSSWSELWLQAGAKYPPSTRMNMEIMISIWTINYWLIMVKDLYLRLDRVSFLIVYRVSPDGLVKPRRLGKFGVGNEFQN